jgi:hypothetical protein
MKRHILLLFCAAALAGCFKTIIDPAIETPEAVITVAFDGKPGDTLRIVVTDSATIVAAERFVSTGQGPHLVTGTIVRGSGVDTRYPFHFRPESVRIVDAAIELCDGAPMRTSQAVEEFFQGSTGSASSESAQWCPWASRPIKVERSFGA